MPGSDLHEYAFNLMVMTDCKINFLNQQKQKLTQLTNLLQQEENIRKKQRDIETEMMIQGIFPR